MLIDEMKHDRCGFGNDQFTVHPSGDSSVRVDLEIVLGLLCIASSINEDEVIFDSYFFQQDEPRSAGIRREILKLTSEPSVRVFVWQQVNPRQIGHNIGYPKIPA